MRATTWLAGSRRCDLPLESVELRGREADLAVVRTPDGHGRVELSTFHTPVADLDHATDSRWDWVAEQTRTYLAFGGSEGHESNGVHTLVLARTGCRTGIPRRPCLIYGTAGEDPAWFKNLRADPSVGVQVGGRRFTARARVASPAERELLRPRMVRVFPLYDEDAQRTDREIRIVPLTPQD
ncbi:nitroreductase/quinone reductase family protein [Streptomyces sp. DG2A-72]|uniref:nitroreductase/quinone reductase family protein n=1 Tax=Streptomyces sp. DG2A-72 TaxID=3051386 RepID=UPI00265C3A68|nr:nitroreductase/quinone reductase family protein [Streptomyces sp. DG2A-72]MDO0930877.1 nitroreductase/quinone reductase family protein [Streptomyces sp. DG2A-72]